MKRRSLEEREKQGRWSSSHTDEVAIFSERATGSCTVASRFGRVAAVLVFAPAFLLGATGTTTQTLSAQIDAIGKLSVPASLTVTTAGTTFVAYSGGLSVSYRARTTATTGSGSLTLKLPTILAQPADPPSQVDSLTIRSAATLGAACSGTQTASTAACISAVTLGPAGWGRIMQFRQSQYRAKCIYALEQSRV